MCFERGSSYIPGYWRGWRDEENEIRHAKGLPPLPPEDQPEPEE